MARQVFSNAIILEGEELEATRGYLVVRDGAIERISGGAAPGRAVNLKYGFILPPFINAHTHIADSVAKELYLGKEQPQVVAPGGVKFRALSSTPLKDIITATRAALLDMLSTGTLAHCDFRERGVAGVDILRRVSTTPVKSFILGRPLNFRELSKVLAKADGIGLPSLNAFSPDELGEIAHQTQMANKLLAVHVAETRAAQEVSAEQTGEGEVKRALELYPSFVVHATHATADDFLSLQKRGVPAVFCPRANSILGAGVPPIHLALEAGTRFYFGTDNVLACQPNMFEEISFAWACLRASNPAAGSDEARKLLMAATIEPLRTFDLPWGPVAEGGRATFMLLARGNNLQNLSDIYAGLINRARADNIQAVFLDGKIVIS
ncbi:MAG: amidohydrolase family protein [Hadesarchaea archaeon]|nr:amidohydrolase family protein [Hadesarchaea archaeon]